VSLAGRRIVLPLTAASVSCALSLYAWPFTIDDAYIPCRYAAHLAGGQGLTWNAGDRVQGVTGFAWTLVLAALRFLGVHDLPSAAKILGLASGLACVAWVVAQARRAAGGRPIALGALLATAGSLSVVVYGIAGLETMAFTLLVTAAAASAVRAPVCAGVLAGLSIAVRPEGALVLGVLCATAGAGRGRKVLAGGLAPAALALLVPWIAWGTLLPNTWFARAAPPGAGFAYLTGALLPTGAIGFWPLAIAGGRRGRFWPMLAVVAALVVATAIEGGDWMPGWRFLVPVWPLTGWLAARGAFVLRLRLGRTRARWAPSVILAAAAGIGLLSTAAILPTVRAAGIERARTAPRLVRALQRRQVHTVALVDVGYVGWAGGFETVDLGGLTDRRIARAAGTYLDKEVDEASLLSRRPDAIVLHAEGPRGEGMFPVERRVAAMPGVVRSFRLVATVRRSAAYRYLVLARARP
jgi:hypothetical protein